MSALGDLIKLNKQKAVPFKDGQSLIWEQGGLYATFGAWTAGAANVTELTITVKNVDGTAVSTPTQFLLWLSDASDGEGLTATTTSGAVTAKASSGTDFGALTAKKCFIGQTKDNGTFILSVTDTAKTEGFYAAVAPIGSGIRKVTSASTVTASYGA